MLKNIPQFKGLYAASTDGKIWSFPKKWANTGHEGKYLKSWTNNVGYEVVCIYLESKKSKKYLVHRLVASTFVKNPKNVKEVNHKNGIKSDNRASNLEWVSSSQNKQHAIRTGLYKRGEENPISVLTDKQISEIREKYKNYVRGLGRKLAKEYKVSTALISLVVNHKNRK